jgi:hypothetical protein
MWHVRERRELRKGFWRENLMAKKLFEDLGVDARIILQLIFKKCYGSVETQLMWHGVGTGGVLLCIR